MSSADYAGDSRELSSRDVNEPACPGGKVWAGDDGGCLTPGQIERWKTSECSDEPFANCQAQRFPQYGDSSRFKDSKLGQGKADEPAARWECSYVPTYDQDWHNDVSCSNDLDEERPYLLPDDSFVTEAEIMAAALYYEMQLNGR